MRAAGDNEWNSQEVIVITFDHKENIFQCRKIAEFQDM